ncbi:uncharacterized membrane protein YjjB (DUF3815 family) [Natranaerovirga hydrolytica]|uniref:Uncharacterized membrane protein YjjB (DUF3815 family) n=1 Tax=Natranaerovirga hydrolytica TaxID=680378 RepID=A0A4R1MZ14_9FIRM|nr:threonine/serine exporter family protein [Natranaerovirga hydrolytica]TCK98557.1 uncharacterized membrane protein YjjB (DUF3815 family) [Natranaerovirga hydrolytica]
MIIQIASAFFATLFFSVIFNIARHHLLYCGITGAIGWAFYLTSLSHTNSVVFSSFIGALAVTSVSQVLAKRKKTPVTVFLITGIIPLVPGAGMYQTVYHILIQDYGLASHYGIQTFQIAGVISIAIILLDTFNKLIYQKRQ